MLLTAEYAEFFAIRLRRNAEFHTESTEKNFIRLFYNIWLINIKYKTPLLNPPFN